MMKHCTCCHQIERPWLHRICNDVALAQFKIRFTHIDQRQIQIYGYCFSAGRNAFSEPCDIDPLPHPTSSVRAPGRTTPSASMYLRCIGSNNCDISARRVPSPFKSCPKTYFGMWR